MVDVTIHGQRINDDETSLREFEPQELEELVNKLVRIVNFLDENHSFLEEEDIVLDAATQGTNLNWPNDIHDNDMFIVLGSANGLFQRLIRGQEINDLMNGAVGTTLTAAQRLSLFQYGTMTLRAYIGKDANNQFLIQSAAADNAGHVEIWRFRKARV